MTPEISIRATSGDIEDEFDRPPEMVVRLAENRWRVGGGVSVRSLKKIFQGIPETSGTINDLVKSNLSGKELKENYQIQFHGIIIKVRRVVRGYVYDVVVCTARNGF